jgi:hypothetical protein
MKFNKVLKEALSQLGGQVGGQTLDIYLDFAWSSEKLQAKALKFGKKNIEMPKPSMKELDDAFVQIRIPSINKKSGTTRMRKLLMTINELLGKKIIDDKGELKLKQQILDFMAKYPNKSIAAGRAGESMKNPAWDARIKLKQLRPGGVFVLSLINGLEVVARNEKEISLTK